MDESRVDFANLPVPALDLIFTYISSVYVEHDERSFYKKKDFPLIKKKLRRRTVKIEMNQEEKDFWIMKRLYSLSGVCRNWHRVLREKSYRKPSVGCKIMGKDRHYCNLYIYGGKGNRMPTYSVRIEDVKEALYPSQLVVRMELYDLYLDMELYEMLMSLDLSKLKKFKFYKIRSIDLNGRDRELMPRLFERLTSAKEIEFLSDIPEMFSNWPGNEVGAEDVESDVTYDDAMVSEKYRSIFRRKERYARRKRQNLAAYGNALAVNYVNQFDNQFEDLHLHDNM